MTAENIINITITTVAMGMITATTSGRDITDHATTNACVTYPLQSTIQDRPFRLASRLEAATATATAASHSKSRASDWRNTFQLLANQARLSAFKGAHPNALPLAQGVTGN